MLWCHAHSAPTASDARRAGARRCTNRLEVGRRARRHALLGSPDARRLQDGAFGRQDRHRSSVCRTACAAALLRAATRRSALPSALHHEPSVWRIDREHRRPGAGERSRRTRVAPGSQSRYLFGWAEGWGRSKHCYVAHAHRSAARRAHIDCGRGRWARQSCPGEPACDVLCAPDVDRQSACRSCASPPAACAPSSGGKQQNSGHPTVLCRSEWRTQVADRSANESTSEVVKPTLTLAASLRRAVTHRESTQASVQRSSRAKRS